MKRLFVIMLCSFFVGTPLLVQAGSLAELDAAVHDAYTSGEISDADVKATLDDIIAEAQAATDAAAENAYRGSIVDIVTAFNGAGISSTAAATLTGLAQP